MPSDPRIWSAMLCQPGQRSVPSPPWPPGQRSVPSPPWPGLLSRESPSCMDGPSCRKRQSCREGQRCREGPLFHPQRFSTLKRAVDGISQRMLTVTLRGLERDGIVSRTMYPVMPPRVDYALTPLGHTLLDAVGALMAWVDEHLAEVDAARDAYDARSSRDVAELPVPAPARSQEAGASRVLRQPGLTSPT